MFNNCKIGTTLDYRTTRVSNRLYWSKWTPMSPIEMDYSQATRKRTSFLIYISKWCTYITVKHYLIIFLIFYFHKWRGKWVNKWGHFLMKSNYGDKRLWLQTLSSCKFYIWNIYMCLILHMQCFFICIYAHKIFTLSV